MTFRRVFFLTLIFGFFCSAMGGEEKMTKLTVDFSQCGGEIKALHGINNSAVELYQPMSELAAAGIPYSRLHDTAGPYGGAHFVDVPNVFPNFDADPNDPASYDFAMTDAYLKQLHAAGVEPFYRLGVTIENNFRIKAYQNHPPKNFAKWAEICAGIVRHYNHGWANGMKLGITYWEIWNEPENPPMWSGSKEQYFDLYAVTAKRLKREFPEIRIGGYAGCGFYAINRENRKKSAFYRGFLTWFDDFLVFVKKNELPFDFYSWHLYSGDPEELRLHARYVKEHLLTHGFGRVESMLNEWNFFEAGNDETFVLMRKARGASYVAAAMCVMQEESVDKAMFYDARPDALYGGLYEFPSMKLTPTYYSFKSFDLLYQLKNAVKVSGCKAGLYATAATDQKGRGAILIANPSGVTHRIRLESSLAPTACILSDRTHLFAPITPEAEITLAPESVLLVCCGHAETLIRKGVKGESKSVFAGIDDAGKSEANQ